MDQTIFRKPGIYKWKKRYCLWLEDATPNDLKSMPLVMQRIQSIKEFRARSSKSATRKKAETPWLFDEVRPPKTNPFIAVPETSSQRRKYVPIGFIEDSMIPGNAIRYIATGSLYVFGIIMSSAHNSWLRTVCGRLKSDYRYSIGIVYNNFPWPGVSAENIDVPVEDCVSKEVREQIEACAAKVLDARSFYVKQAKEADQSCSLADMYDPENEAIYTKLTSAHVALDAAVEAAYGVNFAGDEEKIVAHLFSLYEQLTKNQTQK